MSTNPTRRPLIDPRTLSPAGQEAALQLALATRRIMARFRDDPGCAGYWETLARLDAEAAEEREAADQRRDGARPSA